MVAAAADGSDSNGIAVKAHHHQGTVTPSEARRRKRKPCNRAESVSPDSTLTTEAPSSRGGVDHKLLTAAAAASSSCGGNAVEELQQQTNGKKPRLVWTTELHEKFVRAYKSLGRRDAVPKKILTVMQVNGLTRENVASHLQKYRQNLHGRGQAIRRRERGGATAMVHQIAPSFEAAFPQAHQSIEPAFPQAPSPSPSLNPPPQGSFAAANMSHPQIGHGQGLPNLVHQPRGDFPVVLPPVFCRMPEEIQAEIERRRKMIMERQAKAQHAARMKNQAAVAPGHHYTVGTNYELGAQTLARAQAAATGVQSHGLLQQGMQASRAVNMSGGLYCPVPEMRDEQMETCMGIAQLQNAVGAEAGQMPATPDNGGQQEDSCGVLHFWNTASEPSMDHEFPPNNPI